jgi:hypothetical protein
MASIFGTLFRVSTWGESHGGGVGCVIDGCPARLPITLEEIQVELDRRRPGQSDIVTPRQEEDRCRILSGVFQGKTLGTPILVAVDNKDARPSAYTEMETMFRPSHADYTYQSKYGIRNWEGGGRSSARETIGRVAAGVVAAKIVRSLHPSYEVVAWVRSIHDIGSEADPLSVTIAEYAPRLCLPSRLAPLFLLEMKRMDPMLTPMSRFPTTPSHWCRDHPLNHPNPSSKMSHFGFIFESNRYPAATDNFISPIAFYNSSCNRSAIVSILTFGRPRRLYDTRHPVPGQCDPLVRNVLRC